MLIVLTFVLTIPLHTPFAHTLSGEYSYFYEDNKQRTLLASFTPLGTGFVNHTRKPSAPRFVATKATGTISDEVGGGGVRREPCG
jgi:hypothetical protein